MPAQKNDAAVAMLQSIHMHFHILFEALYRKGIIDYADIQEAISKTRDSFTNEQYSALVRDQLNILESLYQPGKYQSPLTKPDEPHR